MRVHTFDVGPGHPCFIVAEGGSNHGGSLDAALALTDAVAEAGANAMKWQLWTNADEMYDQEQFPTEHMLAAAYRLPVEWLPTLRDRAHERGMAFGLSSFGFASLDEADKWVDFHKIASIEATWRPFTDMVPEKCRPVLWSIGMMDKNDMMNLPMMVDQVVYLTCVVAYPAELGDQNLLLMKNWGTEPWGLSDHTLHPTIAPCAAVALGACVIEKHIKLEDSAYLLKTDRSNYFSTWSPDMDHSIDPRQFKEMVSAIRMTEQALGSSEKRIRPSEEPYLKYRRGPKGLRGS